MSELTDIERRWSAALDTGCPSCGPVDDCDHIEGYHHALSDVRGVLPETPAHLAPEVELRLERLVDAANEAEIRWLLGEWLTEIARVIPPGEEVA